MKIKQTPLKDFLIIDQDIHFDDRGQFAEIYQSKRYKQVGIKDNFVQDNHSHSKKGVLRGMHFQKIKPQAQILTVISGKIYDVVVDIRMQSETYGKWYGLILGNGGFSQVYMPPGFAHGFCVLSDFADLHYKVSEYYDSKNESGFLWNDPDIGIKWPITNPIINNRDLNYPLLKELS